MSGERFYSAGRTGEEPPRTWGMRANDGIWDFDLKLQRAAQLKRGVLCTAALAVTIAAIVWRFS